MKHLMLFALLFAMAPSHGQTVGWFYSNTGNADGYILFAPNNSDTTYLIDKCGKRIHEWKSDQHPGMSCHLLADGRLLRCGDTNNNNFMAGGSGGMVELLDWEGTVLWSYEISDNEQCQHHDAIMLPNGNVLAISWEYHTEAEAVDEGRNPSTVNNSFWSEKLLEIQPVGADSGIIVWEWHAFDHLIQDYSSAEDNFGVVGDHPELIDINAGGSLFSSADWLHINGLDYNEEFDQIIMSAHNLNEIWIIDHSTTTAEAASHSGGNSGMGGDLLYRWGNPVIYDRGTNNDQKLYGQHNATWIPDGYPGEGGILLYNNGTGRPGGNYSTVEVIMPPAMVNNTYPINAGDAFEPVEQDWIYPETPDFTFFSSNISGAQRLANGNTIICEGASGNFFEVDLDGNELWKYVNPVGNIITTQGNNPNMNSVFRCIYLLPNEPGLYGQSLVPGSPIEIDPLTYECESNPVGMNEPETEIPGSIFPNPFHGTFYFTSENSIANGSITVSDMLGRIIYSENAINITAGNPISISIQPVSGIMLLQIWDENGKLITARKLIGI